MGGARPWFHPVRQGESGPLKSRGAFVESAPIAPLRRAIGAMETVNEIKERLSAKSRTATLEELRSEGRKQVRLIRAEHIAAMVSQAVHAAIENSGLIDPAEHEQLVEKSREEFKEILSERQAEAKRAEEVERRLAERTEELETFRSQVTSLDEALNQAKAELAEKGDGDPEIKNELELAQRSVMSLEAEVERCKGEAESARAEAEAAKASAQQLQMQMQQLQQMQAQMPQQVPAMPMPMQQPQAAGNTDMMMSLFQEMANLKASMQAGQQQVAAAPADSSGADVGAMLEKLTSSLNDRLETFGKKMGISAAVESDVPTDFSGLFKGAEANLESNMDNVEVKKKTGGGIAANLAKLKKLKGG